MGDRYHQPRSSDPRLRSSYATCPDCGDPDVWVVAVATETTPPPATRCVRCEEKASARLAAQFDHAEDRYRPYNRL
jgi:hypothetical protein